MTPQDTMQLIALSTTLYCIHCLSAVMLGFTGQQKVHCYCAHKLLHGTSVIFVNENEKEKDQ